MLWSRLFSGPERAPKSQPVTGSWKGSLNRIFTINCRAWIPRLSSIVSRFEHSAHTSRDQHQLPLKSMLLIIWTHMHRCYAYCRYVCILYHNSSIIIASKRQPLTNGRIADLNAGGERAGKTGQSTSWTCHDTIWTQILIRSSSFEVIIPGFWW